ncbi:MAG TPA: hypothetical protein VGO47_01630 [Chlamydiales bacterium]|nr:hypothetical protein [Chlamydiales bacterium]
MEEELPGKDWIAACHACACNPRKLPHYPADWIPQNCAYTPLTTINDLVPSPVFPKPDSPRAHGLLNGGVVLLHPSMEIARGLYNFLYKSPLVSKFLFPGKGMLCLCHDFVMLNGNRSGPSGVLFRRTVEAIILCIQRTEDASHYSSIFVAR